MFLIQLFWHNDLDGHEQIAATISAQMRHAMLSYAKGLAVLGTSRDSEFHIAVECRHVQIIAKRGLDNIDWQVQKQISPLTLKKRMAFYTDHHEETTRRTAADSSLAFTRKTNLSSVIDARWNLDAQLARLLNALLSMTILAWRRDDFTIAFAARACRDIDEGAKDGLSRSADFATAVALRAANRRRAGFCAAAVTIWTGLEARDLEFFFNTKDSLFERKRQIVFEVRAGLRSAPRAAARSETEKFFKDIRDAKATHITKAALRCIVTKAIVHLPFVRVG